jgi:hypothetical protein
MLQALPAHLAGRRLRLSPFLKDKEKGRDMLRTVAKKVAWVGRTASMVFGLALVLALMFGVASMAFGANGDFFKVGRSNLASAVSTLTKSGAGPALSLKVGSGAPLAVNSSQKVAKLNSDQVDGLDSTQFVKGGGTASQGKEAIPADSGRTILTTSNPDIRVDYACPFDPINDSGILEISNPGSETLNVFVDISKSSNIAHYEWGHNDGDIFSLARSGSHVTIQAQGTNVATIEMFSYHRATDCHTQAQALVTR